MTPQAHETEAGFTRAVIELAKLYGWLVNHQLPLRTLRGWATGTQGDAGFPDIVAAKLIDGVPRVVFAELKTDRGRLSAAQERWVRELGARVWRPADWPEIEATFKGGA